MNILVVDDLETNRKLLAVTLEAEGFGVIKAGDGLDALKILESADVDAVISDILMPQMDGYRLCLEIRKDAKTKDLPFIFYTSTYTSPADRQLALEVGADKFLTKPVPAQELLAALREAMETNRRRHKVSGKTKKELDIVREYSEVLVAKLEEKNRELEESVDRFQLVIEASADGMLLTDGKGNIELVNAEIERIFGYSRSELKGQPVELLIPARVRSQHRTHRVAMTENPAARPMSGRELAALRKNGAEITVEVGLNPLVVKGQRYVLACVVDVTQRKRAELALRESEARLKEAQQNASIGSWRYLPDGTIFWSDQMYELFKLPRDASPTYDQALAKIHPDDRSGSYNKALERAIESGAVDYHAEYRVVWPDGQIRNFVSIGKIHREENGRMIEAVGTVQDVTERKQSEENLRFQKMLLESQNEASVDGILIVNTTGKIIWYNRRFVETWGIPTAVLQSGSDEAAMKSVLDKLVSPAEFAEKVKYLYEHTKVKSSDEIFLKDGRILDRYSSPMENGDGEYLGRVWLFRDITSRKQAEAALALASSQMKNLHDNLDEALFSVDVVENKMLEVSNAHEVIFGYKPEEFFKNPRLWYEIIIPEDKPVIDAGYPVLSTGKSLQHQFRITRPDGQMRWIEARIKPTLDGSGRLVRIDGIASDVTERKRAEQALIESQDRFKRLAEASSEVFWIFDPRALQILYVSPAYEKVWGRSCQSLYDNGLSFLEAVHPDDQAREVEVFKQQAAGFPTDTEYRLVHPDGSIRWVWDRGYPARNESGEVYMVTGMAQDITERKLAGEKLRESEEQFRMIAENVADLIVVLDTAGNRLYNSPSYTNILGEPDLLKGTPSFDEVHPEDRERIKSLFFDTVRTGIGHRAEFRFINKDGAIRDIESNGSAIRDENGNVSRVLVVSRDITEKKKLEAQFLRAQRMESVGALAGGIAHDLNNVLAPILMAVEILKKKHPDNDTQRILNTLESSAQRGSGMIRQVLTFARGIEGERAPVQVGHLIREMEKIIRETFPKSIQLKTQLPKNLWIVSADVTQLHQVLLNLCVNARDAMPGGGMLTLSAENVMVDENYARMQSQAKVGPHIAITITDAGTGIPPHVIDKIFDPFFTTKEVGKGTGLGLSTVHSIVKSHGGFINVYSEMGKGTKFHIYIPAEPAGVNLQVELEQVGLPTGNGELILVVDDEASIRDICQVTLETYGYSVLTAADGTEAVVQYSRKMNEIRLVITDMMMPFMDGRATIRALTKMNPKVRIIASSGLSAEEKSIDRRDLTMYAFLPKPYTAGTLLTTVSEVLAATLG